MTSRVPTLLVSLLFLTFAQTAAAQSAPSPTAAATHVAEQPRLVLHSERLEAPARGTRAKQLASALVVSGLGTFSSVFLFDRTLGFGGIPALVILGHTPLATAAMVDGVGRWNDDKGRYRGAMLGSFAGALLGVGAGAGLMVACDPQFSTDDGTANGGALALAVPITVGTALGAVLGYEASSRRQRRILSERVALSGGAAPTRAGAVLALSGRF